MKEGVDRFTEYLNVTVIFTRVVLAIPTNFTLFFFKELSNGNCQTVASEVRMHHVDNGPGYLCCRTTLARNGTCAKTFEVQIRDQTKEATASKWKPKENGAIPCPLAYIGGCDKGTLNLRCIIFDDWISQLLLKAQEILQKYKMKEKHTGSELHNGENGSSDGKLRKIADGETSNENYVFCTTAGDDGMHICGIFKSIYLRVNQLL